MVAQCPQRQVGPIIPFEDHVAVHPGDALTGGGHGLQGDVHQPFLLPKHGLTAYLNEGLGIRRREFEVTGEGQFHADKRRDEPAPEDVVVVEFAAKSGMIEVACNRPQHECTTSFVRCDAEPVTFCDSTARGCRRDC